MSAVGCGNEPRAVCVLHHFGVFGHSASESARDHLWRFIRNGGDEDDEWSRWLDGGAWYVEVHLTHAAFEEERERVLCELHTAQIACQWRRVWRERAFQVCVALQELSLPVLQTVMILDELDTAVKDTKLHVKWDVARTVKHRSSVQ